MQFPSDPFPALQTGCIHALARCCAQWMEQAWHQALRTVASQAAHGPVHAAPHAAWWLRPLRRAFDRHGLVTYPPLPGSSSDAREWTSACGSHVERWCWCSVAWRDRDDSLGTLVTVIHQHPASRRLLQPPGVLGLDATGRRQVQGELARAHARFAASRPVDCGAAAGAATTQGARAA